MTTDIVIVGKGIAALVLATLLQRGGHDFVLLDRQAKVKAFDLAETLPPSALPLLQNIGLLQLFQQHCIRKTNGYHSVWGSERLKDHNFYFHRPFRHGLKVHKARLLEQLEKQGQFRTFTYKHLLEVQSTQEGAQLTYQYKGKVRQLKAHVLIDATGRNRALLKWLNISTLDYDTSCAFSVHLPRKRHPRIKHDVFVESFQEGWGLISGLNEAQNILSIYTNAQSPIFRKASAYPNWPNILQNTQYLKYFLVEDPTIKVRGKKSNSSKPQQIAGQNWLAVGDAALAFDPLSSHGISNALYTAMCADQLIPLHLQNPATNPFKEYAQSMEEIFRAYLKSKRMLYQSEGRWSDAPFWENAREESILAVG
ncbi:MAG: FAD-dependent monooxygenase [Bacteroidota bacterium]